jgi:hypothetical protein
MVSKELLALLVALRVQRDSLALSAQAVALRVQRVLLEAELLEPQVLLEAMELMAQLVAQARLESKEIKVLLEQRV